MKAFLSITGKLGLWITITRFWISSYLVHDTNIQYHNDVNNKQRKTLEGLFDLPVRKNIKWSDIEKLILAVGGEIRQADGSRVRIVLGDTTLNIHTPHPQKELKPYQVRALKRLFNDRDIEQ